METQKLNKYTKENKKENSKQLKGAQIEQETRKSWTEK